MATKRNYKAEYERRKALGKERGVSVAQAVGHPRKTLGESSVRELKEAGISSVQKKEREQLRRYYRVSKRITSGESIKKAAKAEGISPNTVYKMNMDRETYSSPVHRRGTRPSYTANERTIAFFNLNKQGSINALHIPVDRNTASDIGKYLNEVGNAITKGERVNEVLMKYDGRTIVDMKGVQRPYVTDANALLAYFESMSPEAMRVWFEHVYKLRKAS